MVMFDFLPRYAAKKTNRKTSLKPAGWEFPHLHGGKKEGKCSPKCPYNSGLGFIGNFCQLYILHIVLLYGSIGISEPH